MQSGEQHIGHGLRHGQGNGRVVDVLGSQTKMNELRSVLKANRVELALDEILHRLYVVVRGFLYVLHCLGIRRTEVDVDAAQPSRLFLGQGLK